MLQPIGPIGYFMRLTEDPWFYGFWTTTSTFNGLTVTARECGMFRRFHRTGTSLTSNVLETTPVTASLCPDLDMSTTSCSFDVCGSCHRDYPG